MEEGDRLDRFEHFEHLDREAQDNSPDRYWKEFVRTGKVKDYLRYALELRDK